MIVNFYINFIKIILKVSYLTNITHLQVRSGLVGVTDRQTDGQTDSAAGNKSSKCQDRIIKNIV